MRAYELAAKMQLAVPEVMDIKQEPQTILEWYGAQPGAASFANNCLLARRLVERGVRFVQLYHEAWDQHGNLVADLKKNCRDTDKACAALIKDLKQRGMLDDTLVVFGTEFGRTPAAQGKSDGTVIFADCRIGLSLASILGNRVLIYTLCGRTGDSHHEVRAMADEADNPPFPVGRASNVAIQATWARQAEDAAHMVAATSWSTGTPLPLRAQEQVPSLTVTSVIIPEGKTPSGLLVKSTSAIWNRIVKELGNDWSLAYQIPPERWEEIVAGAFKNDGYHEVILTPRSRDHGRDVIAFKHGLGCVKVLGSVKANAPDRLVPYDAVRALMGVIASERDTSKGIITTTSDFPPLIESDPLIAPLLPTRLELVNGAKLQKWLVDLSKP
jgi:restriction system protein